MKHNLKIDFNLVDHYKVDLLIGTSGMGYIALIKSIVVSFRQKDIS